MPRLKDDLGQEFCDSSTAGSVLQQGFNGSKKRFRRHGDLLEINTKNHKSQRRAQTIFENFETLQPIKLWHSMREDLVQFFVPSFCKV